MPRGRRPARRRRHAPREARSSRSSGSGSARRTFARRSRSRQALTTIRCSQVVTAESPRKDSARLKAEMRASWSASAASSGLPVVRSATAHSRSRWRANSSPKAAGSPATCASSRATSSRSPPWSSGGPWAHDLTVMSVISPRKPPCGLRAAWSARRAGSASSGSGRAAPSPAAGRRPARPDLVELVEALRRLGHAGRGGVHLEGGGCALEPDRHRLGLLLLAEVDHQPDAGLQAAQRGVRRGRCSWSTRWRGRRRWRWAPSSGFSSGGSARGSKSLTPASLTGEPWAWAELGGFCGRPGVRGSRPSS